MPGGPAYVIVGASLAGAKAAETLRDEGFGGTIVLVGEEMERPYERPPLSKDYLLGKAAKSSIYVHEEGWYAGHDVDLLLGTAVTAIDRSGSRIELADGSAITYDRLLLTPGASPRRLDVPGGDLGGVRYLRTAGDSERLGAALADAGQVGIVGAGWVGPGGAAGAPGRRPAGRRRGGLRGGRLDRPGGAGGRPRAGLRRDGGRARARCAAPLDRPRAGRDVRRLAPRARRDVPVRGGGHRAARIRRAGRRRGHVNGRGAAR